jgi:hypothetical protein
MSDQLQRIFLDSCFLFVLLEVRCGFGLNLMQVICSNFLVERLQSAMVSLLSTRVVARRHRPGHLGADAAAAAGGEV